MTESLFATQIGTTGPRVVFLHGLFGQGKNWTGIARSLADSAQSTLIDLPNHGRSAWTTDFSYVEMARQVAEALETTAGSYAVVGHSMGGKVAMMLALLRPDLVSRLCVVDIAPVASTEVGQFDGFVAGMRALDRNTLTDRGAADQFLQARVPDPAVRSFLLQNLRRDPAHHPPWRWQVNLEVLGDALGAIGGWPDVPAPPYPHPVLWMAGAESRYIQPAYGPAMRTLFPRTRLVTIKGAGHWVHSEQPAVFTAILRQFLGLAE